MVINIEFVRWFLYRNWYLIKNYLSCLEIEFNDLN